MRKGLLSILFLSCLSDSVEKKGQPYDPFHAGFPNKKISYKKIGCFEKVFVFRFLCFESSLRAKSRFVTWKAASKRLSKQEGAFGQIRRKSVALGTTLKTLINKGLTYITPRGNILK